MSKYKITDFNKGNPITYIFNSKEDAEKSTIGIFDNRVIEEATEEDEKQLHKIYLAAPLFTDVQKRRINEVVTWLRALGNEVYSPMEYTVENAWGISNKEWARKVYDHDIEDLMKADTVVCLYDGMDSDTGTAWELGYAHALGKMVFTICNDVTTKQSLMVINGSNSVCGLDNWKNAWLDFVRNSMKYASEADIRIIKVDTTNLKPSEAFEVVNKIKESYEATSDGLNTTNLSGESKDSSNGETYTVTTTIYVPDCVKDIEVKETVVPGGNYMKFMYAPGLEDQS